VNRRISLIDRAVALLTGLAAVAGGVWTVGLFLDVPLAQAIAGRIDFSAWRSAPVQDWFDLVLAGILLLSAALGGLLIALNVRRYRINRVLSPSSDERGTIGIDLAALADAVARDLEEHPRVGSAHAVVADSRGRPTMTLTVHARPDADVPALVAVLGQSEREFRAAVPGIELDTVYRLHLYPVGR
jgi:hypothetical protein